MRSLMCDRNGVALGVNDYVEIEHDDGSFSDGVIVGFDGCEVGVSDGCGGLNFYAASSIEFVAAPYPQSEAEAASNLDVLLGLAVVVVCTAAWGALAGVTATLGFLVGLILRERRRKLAQ